MTDPEGQVRAAVEDLAAAIRAKDVDAVMARYAPDLIAFDLLPPLQHRGAAMVRKRLSAWFSSFPGSIGFAMRDLIIAASDDVAFCHSLNRVRGTTNGGGKVDMWWRATNGFRKTEDRWLVTHGHSSEPFDMGSGKALIDLKP
jgi:ketosteroid isomerase-like protein